MPSGEVGAGPARRSAESWLAAAGRVQLVTGPWTDLADLERRTTAAIEGGIRWVQLRAQAATGRDLHAAAAVLAALCGRTGARLVINDRLDLALDRRADGVHLPERGLAPPLARRLIGDDRWLAVSTHSRGWIADPNVDAVQFGPIYATASKLEFGAPQGIEALRELSARLATSAAPNVIAVGGIDESRIAEVAGAGAAAVSVIGTVWGSRDVARAAASLVETAREAWPASSENDRRFSSR